MLILVFDYLLMNAAFISALYLRFSSFTIIEDYIALLVVANIVFFPIAIVNGVYRGTFKIPLPTQKRQLKVVIIMLAFILALFVFLAKGEDYSRAVIIIFLMSQYFLLSVWRSLAYRLNQFLLKHGFGKKRSIIIGTDRHAVEFYDILKNHYRNHYQIYGFVVNGAPEKTLNSIRDSIIGKEENLPDILETHPTDNIFIVKETLSDSHVNGIRQSARRYHAKVKVVSPKTDDLIQRLNIRDITGIPFSTGPIRYRYMFVREKLKRMFDLFAVIVASVILAPMGLLIALLIKMTSKGPVFFKQDRSLYKGENTFSFLKFRTMYENAEELKDELRNQNESDGALFKMKNDPRVTPIGKILRKYSLDEIPQFINVLKGEMSIVGPRPLPVEDFEMLNGDLKKYNWCKIRGEAKPGITGLWQISGRSDLSFEEMCLLDLYYIENQSILFDIEIIFDTIPIVLLGKGAY